MTKKEALALKQRLEHEIARNGYSSLSEKKKIGYDKLRGYFGQAPAQQVLSEAHRYLAKAARGQN